MQDTDGDSDAKGGDAAPAPTMLRLVFLEESDGNVSLIIAGHRPAEGEGGRYYEEAISRLDGNGNGVAETTFPLLIPRAEFTRRASEVAKRLRALKYVVVSTALQVDPAMHVIQRRALGAGPTRYTVEN